ncbi:hypothetical protein SASPL_111816 [Salvia splendens]|uniref:Uncharacterized protein n=1 Tax=Salvia splendens TaxID=180675 RepID=A0A8X8Y8T4_SALSN|nr:hypothetical protein SASPL_111816 [Salvia splendens]
MQKSDSLSLLFISNCDYPHRMSNVGQLPMPNNLHSGGVPKSKLKRKTPSELRGELLKKKNLLEGSNDSGTSTSSMNADGAVSESNKSDPLKALRLRTLDEHFPVTKSNSNDKHEVQNSCLEGTVASEDGNDTSRQINNSSDKCITNTFKSVRDLSFGGGMIYNSTLVDMIGVDNTPQSLLMFAGRNVHSLSLYTPLSSDVPVLYSPVPFENAALCAPEVRCKQVRRVEHMSSQVKDSNMYSEPMRSSSPGICYNIEIRDA